MNEGLIKQVTIFHQKYEAHCSIPLIPIHNPPPPTFMLKALKIDMNTAGYTRGAIKIHIQKKNANNQVQYR